MKRYIYKLTVLLVIASLSYSIMAQNTRPLAINEKIKGHSPKTPEYAVGEELKNAIINGPNDYYLNDDWVDGLAMLEDNSIIGMGTYRYNVAKNEMEFIKDEDTLIITHPDKLKFVSIGDKTFYYDKYRQRKENGESYFEWIGGFNFKLFLKRDYVEYIDPVTDEPVQEEISSYFLKKCDEPAIPLYLCERGILNAMSDKKNEIGSYLERENPNLKNEKELVSLIEYYNSLYY